MAWSQPILLPKTFVGVADELIGSVAFLIEKEVLKCSFNQVSLLHCMHDTLSRPHRHTHTHTNMHALHGWDVCVVARAHVQPMSPPCCGMQLGGVLLEKELRSLISYASSLMDWSIRDKFTRLLQVATLLSLAAVSA